MQWPFGKTRRVKCPDGTERTVFRTPDHAFPLAAKDWSARWEATVNALKGLQVGLGGDLGKYIEGFFAELDRANRSMQFNFRAIYVVYTSNPCDMDGWLMEETRKVIEREDILRRAEVEISRIKSVKSLRPDHEALRVALVEAKTRLSKTDLEDQTSSEFKKVEKNTLAWREQTE